MTGSKVFLDTSPFIYFIEGCKSNPEYYEKMKLFFQNSAGAKLFTSAVTVEEYLTLPFKNEANELENIFRKTLDLFDIHVIKIDYEIAKGRCENSFEICFF